jgi:SnoaL-like protein
VDADLRRLLDRQEIADLLTRYCRGVDRCDAELINSAFHPDAVDEHSYRRLSGTEVGPFLAQRMQTAFKRSLHCLLQSRVALDGDAAGAETYFVAWLVREEDGREVVDQAAGRYVDRFERREGEWRIVHRVVLPEVAVRLDRLASEHLSYLDDRPQRSREDVSYSALQTSSK